jgi:DNA topoisomerase VI subunit B
VATQVSKRRINWTSYKIRHNQDKLGIFVSLVSTKVPFKGTGKEYIGDDIPEVQAAVKRAIERCCLQLKAKIVKQRAAADDRERRKNLTRYIPDVSRAIFTVIEKAAKRQAERDAAAAVAGGPVGMDRSEPAPSSKGGYVEIALYIVSRRG